MTAKQIIKGAYSSSLDNSDFILFGENIGIQIACTEYLGKKLYHVRVAKLSERCEAVYSLNGHFDDVDSMTDYVNELKVKTLPKIYGSVTNDFFSDLTN